MAQLGEMRAKRRVKSAGVVYEGDLLEVGLCGQGG
jgi:hypothetical protein